MYRCQHLVFFAGSIDVFLQRLLQHRLAGMGDFIIIELGGIHAVQLGEGVIDLRGQFHHQISPGGIVKALAQPLPAGYIELKIQQHLRQFPGFDHLPAYRADAVKQVDGMGFRCRHGDGDRAVRPADAPQSGIIALMYQMGQLFIAGFQRQMLGPAFRYRPRRSGFRHFSGLRFRQGDKRHLGNRPVPSGRQQQSILLFTAG